MAYVEKMPDGSLIYMGTVVAYRLAPLVNGKQVPDFPTMAAAQKYAAQVGMPNAQILPVYSAAESQKFFQSA
jgi:hypothetical protein